ncbi:GNAT family N-acetyltransferase [Paraburkholderia sp. PREW-6R]|uniref:GNAT family N-acetyltransferase n=1 Tax=Paraburkholderia sp. PREW-6R TaxID=3141544 RepID=UPI0031F47D9C
MSEATLKPRRESESRITVRAFEPSDVTALAEIMSLPGVRRGTLSVGYRSIEQLTAWHEKRGKNDVTVCACVDGKVVGHASLEVFRPSRAHGACLGMAVHDEYHGLGVGTAMLRALTDCADAALGLRRIELTVFADNARAVALYRHFGFVEEGRSRGFAMRDGVLADALHMARLREAPRFEAN